jgi:hypothetical protein
MAPSLVWISSVTPAIRPRARGGNDPPTHSGGFVGAAQEAASHLVAQGGRGWQPGAVGRWRCLATTSSGARPRSRTRHARGSRRPGRSRPGAASASGIGGDRAPSAVAAGAEPPAAVTADAASGPSKRAPASAVGTTGSMVRRWDSLVRRGRGPGATPGGATAGASAIASPALERSASAPRAQRHRRRPRLDGAAWRPARATPPRNAPCRSRTRATQPTRTRRRCLDAATYTAAAGDHAAAPARVSFSIDNWPSPDNGPRPPTNDEARHLQGRLARRPARRRLA